MAAMIAPEIGLLWQFGGIDIAFSALVLSLIPVVRVAKHYWRRVIEEIALGVGVLVDSASANPRVFALQASFCVIAFALTGSVSLSAVFFTPGLLLNNLLV